MIVRSHFSTLHSLGLDVLACPRCGGRLTLIALIEDPVVIARFLRHLGLPHTIPEARPARPPPLSPCRADLATQVTPTTTTSSTTQPDQCCVRGRQARRVPRCTNPALTSAHRSGTLGKERLHQMEIRLPGWLWGWSIRRWGDGRASGGSNVSYPPLSKQVWEGVMLMGRSIVEQERAVVE